MTADDAAVRALEAKIAEHAAHGWEQVGPCVWCTTCNVRLYQGDIPEQKRAVPKCAPDAHDWDMEMGMGFYSQCRICGFTEWNE